MKAHVAAMTVTTAAGAGIPATLAALRAQHSRLVQQPFEGVELETCTGVVSQLDNVTLPPSLVGYDCRSNRLAEFALAHDAFETALAAARKKYGPTRIGVYVGTSGAGILEVELGYRARDAKGTLPSSLRYRESMNLFSPAAYLLERLQLGGPAVVVSAACASSAKAFAAAARAMATGLVDAAVVGGVEALCLTTLYGFRSLELLSTQPCRPCDTQRDGISLGEAAGYVLLTRDFGPLGLALTGFGEGSDAYHLSTPHPEGVGAALAMRAAIAMADVDASAIDYVNLHGTGTRTNDVAEDIAIRSVLGDAVARSSTKGMTGHTLGAAGLVEAVITLVAMRDSFLPGTFNCADVDPAIGGNVILQGRNAPMRHALSNSFGFGGSNCALVFEKAA